MTIENDYFRCARLNGTLTRLNCAQRFVRANALVGPGTGERDLWSHLRVCTGCPVGEAHQMQIQVPSPKPPSEPFKPAVYEAPRRLGGWGSRVPWFQSMLVGDRGDSLMHSFLRKSALDVPGPEGPPRTKHGATWLEGTKHRPEQPCWSQLSIEEKLLTVRRRQRNRLWEVRQLCRMREDCIHQVLQLDGGWYKTRRQEPVVHEPTLVELAEVRERALRAKAAVYELLGRNGELHGLAEPERDFIRGRRVYHEWPRAVHFKLVSMLHSFADATHGHDGWWQEHYRTSPNDDGSLQVFVWESVPWPFIVHTQKHWQEHWGDYSRIPGQQWTPLGRITQGEFQIEPAGSPFVIRTKTQQTAALLFHAAWHRAARGPVRLHTERCGGCGLGRDHSLPQFAFHFCDKCGGERRC